MKICSFFKIWNMWQSRISQVPMFEFGLKRMLWNILVVTQTVLRKETRGKSCGWTTWAGSNIILENKLVVFTWNNWKPRPKDNSLWRNSIFDPLNLSTVEQNRNLNHS